MKYGYSQYAPSICADEYGFHCSTPDCTEHSHDAGDFLKCEIPVCNALVCKEHAVYMPNRDYPLCEKCAVCWNLGNGHETCGLAASFACDECGGLVCESHSLVYRRGGSEDTNDWDVFCSRRCEVAWNERELRKGRPRPVADAPCPF